MCMEYFKKLQCYKPKKAIIDSPISIEEVALLQNSVDKDILGRIRFINRSQQSIIAIFIHLSASNIAGENVPIEKERYIYQDMKIDSGELYGNKIPLHLPDDTRLLTVELEKVVFENGEIGDVATGTECEYIPQEEIDIPAYVIEKVQEELSPHFSHMEYVHYFYEEGQNFWECTCGKINSVLNKKCSFCQNDRQSQKEYLVQDRLISMIAQKKLDKQVEDEEKVRQEAEAERLRKEEEQREYERKQKEWAKLDAEREKERQELERRRKKQKRTWIYIGIITVIVICVIMIVSFYHQKKVNNEIYNNAQELLKSGDYDKAIEEWNRILSYEDSATQIKEATYEKAMSLYENKKYNEAIETWQGISDYKDSSEQINNAYLEIENVQREEALKDVKKKYKETLLLFKDKKYKDAKYISKVISYAGKDAEFMKTYGKFDFDSMEKKDDGKSAISYSKRGKLNGYSGTYNILFHQNDEKCYGITFIFDLEDIDYNGNIAIDVISELLGRKYDISSQPSSSSYRFDWNTDIIGQCRLLITTYGSSSVNMGFFEYKFMGNN